MNQSPNFRRPYQIPRDNFTKLSTAFRSNFGMSHFRDLHKNTHEHTQYLLVESFRETPERTADLLLDCAWQHPFAAPFLASYIANAFSIKDKPFLERELISLFHKSVASPFLPKLPAFLLLLAELCTQLLLPPSDLVGFLLALKSARSDDVLAPALVPPLANVFALLTDEERASVQPLLLVSTEPSYTNNLRSSLLATLPVSLSAFVGVGSLATSPFTLALSAETLLLPSPTCDPLLLLGSATSLKRDLFIPAVEQVPFETNLVVDLLLATVAQQFVCKFLTQHEFSLQIEEKAVDLVQTVLFAFLFADLPFRKALFGVDQQCLYLSAEQSQAAATHFRLFHQLLSETDPRLLSASLVTFFEVVDFLALQLVYLELRWPLKVVAKLENKLAKVFLDLLYRKLQLLAGEAVEQQSQPRLKVLEQFAMLPENKEIKKQIQKQLISLTIQENETDLPKEEEEEDVFCHKNALLLLFIELYYEKDFLNDKLSFVESKAKTLKTIANKQTNDEGKKLLVRKVVEEATKNLNASILLFFEKTLRLGVLEVKLVLEEIAKVVESKDLVVLWTLHRFLESIEDLIDSDLTLFSEIMGYYGKKVEEYI